MGLTAVQTKRPRHERTTGPPAAAVESTLDAAPSAPSPRSGHQLATMQIVPATPSAAGAVPEGMISIVRIVAFHDSTEHATAYRSDGKREAVVLGQNTLAPGTHVLELDLDAKLSYKGAPGFTFVRKDEYTWSASVEVTILPASSPAEQLEEIDLLPAHVQDALFRKDLSRASYEGIQQMLEAGWILLGADVSADDLLLAEQTSGAERDRDPVGWATRLVESQEREARETLLNRERLHSLGAEWNRLSDADKDELAHLLSVIPNAGPFALPASRHVEDFLRDSQLPFKELMTAFEKELRSVTEAFIDHAEIAATRADSLDVGQLSEAIGELSAARAREEAAEHALLEALDSDSASSFVALAASTPHPDARVQAAKERLLNARASREALITERFPLARARGFDLDELVSARSAEHLGGIVKGFVVDLRRRLAWARRKMNDDVKNLYAADRMVEAAKDAAGIDDKLLRDVISFGASSRASERSGWEKLIEVVNTVLMFVPGGNAVHAAVSLAAGGADMYLALNDFSTAQLTYQTNLSDQAPSKAALAGTAALTVASSMMDAADLRSRGGSASGLPDAPANSKTDVSASSRIESPDAADGTSRVTQAATPGGASPAGRHTTPSRLDSTTPSIAAEDASVPQHRAIESTGYDSAASQLTDGEIVKSPTDGAGADVPGVGETKAGATKPMRKPPGGGPRPGVRATEKTITPLHPARPPVSTLPRPSEPLDAVYSAGPDTPAPVTRIVRKSPTAATKRQIIERAGRTTDGRLRDANTGRALNEGEAVFGHHPDYQFEPMRARAEKEGWTQERFDQFFEDPTKWQIEYGPTNSSRVFDRIPRQKPVHTNAVRETIDTAGGSLEVGLTGDVQHTVEEIDPIDEGNIVSPAAMPRGPSDPEALATLSARNEEVRHLVQGRDTAPLPEAGGDMTRSDAELEVARQILRDPNAPPRSQREAMQTVIERAVAEVRASLALRRLPSGGEPLNLTADNLRGMCQSGRDLSAEAIAAHVGSSPHPVIIERVQAAHLGFGAQHGFTVVTLPDGTKFLVDPTFGQFSDQLSSGFTAEPMLSTVEGSTVARDLLRDGAVPLTGDTARQYVMGLGASPADADAAAARLMFSDASVVTEVVRNGKIQRITARTDEAYQHMTTVSDPEVSPLTSLRATLRNMSADDPLRPLLESLTAQLEALARDQPPLPTPVSGHP